MNEKTQQLIDECLASGTPLSLQLAATAYLVEARRLLELAMKMQQRGGIHVVPDEKDVLL